MKNILACDEQAGAIDSAAKIPLASVLRQDFIASRRVVFAVGVDVNFTMLAG